MSNAELELLKRNIDKQVEIDTQGGENLRVKVLFVLDSESDRNLIFDVIPSNNMSIKHGLDSAYSLPLSDIISVRPILKS